MKTTRFEAILVSALASFGIVILIIARSPKGAGLILERVPRSQTDFGLLTVIFREYKKNFGEFPAGSSSEVWNALSGDNPKKIGDPWGTPYAFVREPNPSDLKLRSAGPDRKFNTRDDLDSQVQDESQ